MEPHKISITDGLKEYSFIIRQNTFSLEELAQAFPGATSMAYADNISEKEKIIIPSKNGLFVTPEGGWFKQRRTFHVVKGKEAENASQLRDEKIVNIMKKIRDQKKACTQPQKRKIESTSSHNEKYTRNRNPRIRVGWRHFKNGSFKQGFYKDGGGVREVPLPSLDLDVKAVIQQAKEVIFPTGECKYGDVDQMELCLGDYAGKKLTNFDIQGDDNQCFGKYLQAHGLHLSRCTFYLMTQERITSSIDISSDISDPKISDKKTLGRINKDSKQDSKVYVYTCLVSYADLQQRSKPIQIISIEMNACETSIEPAEPVKPNSDSNSADLAVASDFPVSKKVRIENSDSMRKPDDLEKKNSSCVKESLCFAAPEVKVDDLHIDYSTALGSGAFGTVYKGKWAGSVVAVKALTVTKRNRSIMLDMVEKEINISSRIRHPNIVLFLAVARAPTTIYLVHEYIDGCNMEDAIFDQETRQLMDIKPGDKLFILSQCVQGVAYLHALVPPVIHQDIKPSNIMIKKVCHTTKLCDLGVSRIKSARAASMCTTQIGNACGTPSYMAPECLIHNEKTKISSDIWSLGVTLIEFATEEDAWSVDDVVDTVDAIKKKMTKKEPPIPNVNVKGVPEEVMVSIKLCVNYDKLLRPTAEDVLKCVSSV